MPMPMVLLPPPWFSTTTGCFRRSESFWPTRRERMSAPPPGAYGTMILIGLSGNSARTAIGSAMRRAPSAAAKSLRVGVVIVVVLVGVDGMVRSRGMAMVVVVHQLLRDIGKHLAGRGRRAARPLDAAFLARRGEEILPRKRGRVLRDIQALGEGREDELAD